MGGLQSTADQNRANPKDMCNPNFCGGPNQFLSCKILAGAPKKGVAYTGGGRGSRAGVISAGVITRGGGGATKPDLMRPTPWLSVKTWRGGGGGVGMSSGGGAGGRGGIGGTAGGGGGGVAMVCHWAVQRGQNKDQRHSTPFKESRTRTKHIVPPSTRHAKTKIGAVGTMAPAPLSLKPRGGGGGWGMSHTRTSPPPPVGVILEGSCHMKNTGGWVAEYC